MSDDPSFSDLFRAEYPSVVRDVTFVLGDADAAREVANEAFTRLYVRWARISRYDRPGAWARRVAIRLAVRQRDRGRRQVQLQESGWSSDPGLALDVRDAVASLSPRQRAAVALHHLDGMPLADVASVLGCREGTVKAHLHQARGRLAVILEAYGPQGSAGRESRPLR